MPRLSDKALTDLVTHLEEYPSHVNGVEGCPVCTYYAKGLGLH